MARKSRRAKAKYRARAAKPIQQGGSQSVKAISAESASSTRVPPKGQDTASRYQWVLPEVKRITIIAGAIILVLIILSRVLG